MMESTDISEKFIAIVMEYPFLYDKSKLEFKDVKKKERTWNEVGGRFNATGEWAKHHFKSLREKFLRIKKTIEKDSRSGAGAPKEKEWHIFKLMSFLEEIIKPRRTTSSFNLEGSELFTVVDSQIDIDPDLHNFEFRASSPTTSMFSNVMLSPSNSTGGPFYTRAESETPRFIPAVQPQGESDTFTLKKKESRKRKITNDYESSDVSEALKSISQNLGKVDVPLSCTEAFCTYLQTEMEKLPTPVMEDLKDEIMIILIEKRKALRNIEKIK